MRYLLAAVPILAVLVLMIRQRWGAHQAGPAAWLAGVLVAGLAFGLTPEVFCVSQGKGLLLSVFVLAVMWPALFLYHWNDQNGGITAVARLLEGAIPNRGMCLILLAWALSGLLEGLAGFGLPIAVVAPMLTALGVPPLQAVAAVAVGHSWAVTFGDMGVIFQTLTAVVGLETALLVPWTALLLGAACLICGLVAACILGEARQWPKVALLSLVMGGTQYGLAAGGLLPLSAFGAGLAGMLVYLGCARMRKKPAAVVRPAPALAGVFPQMSDDGTSSLSLSSTLSSAPHDATEDEVEDKVKDKVSARCRRPAVLTVATYGALTLLMAILTMSPALHAWSQKTVWRASFPEVKSRQQFSTPAASGQVFRPLAHPGTLILFVSCVSIGLAGWRRQDAFTVAGKAARATWRSAGAASVGVLSMVGLSTLMEHCGMSYLLAEGLSRLLGAGYPVVSPCVGILGAFATGSNNNSNVLFGALQKNAALLLSLNPYVLTAAQTAGGSLGSMLAPVKIILGCSTVGQVGREGEVLKQTVPYGLAIGLGLGLLTYALSRI